MSGDFQSPALLPLHELPLVYVAGPYTFPDPVENTHNACTVATSLVETGLCVTLTPHATLAWHLATPRPAAVWYAIDLAHLARCDALYRIPGESVGADREVAFARERDIPVFTMLSELLSWLRGEQ